MCHLTRALLAPAPFYIYVPTRNFAVFCLGWLGVVCRAGPAWRCPVLYGFLHILGNETVTVFVFVSVVSVFPGIYI